MWQRVTTPDPAVATAQRRSGRCPTNPGVKLPLNLFDVTVGEGCLKAAIAFSGERRD
jgi:hypothetical protein